MPRSVIVEAEKFLREQLAAGPQPVSVLFTRTEIKPRMLQLAAQHLGVTRTRDSTRGRWIWHLDAADRAAHVPQKALPAPAPEATTADVYTVNHLLELASQALAFPLIVTIKEPPSPEIAGKWSRRVFSAAGVIQEITRDEFTPDDTQCYAYVTIREQQPPPRTGGIFAPGPWSLVLERGQPPEWRDWRYRRPTISAKKTK